ncbi:hypothetical protein [Bacillus pacificus]|uniref:hypothetical protein n=1 Tax=Bacillus pacificus TaxID=2026187 RepID=UPI002E1AC1D8|nr:hypothetical protein [Bacillus pacificus]
MVNLAACDHLCEIACEVIDHFFNLGIQTKNEDEQTNETFFTTKKINKKEERFS